jgi:hypothetical protein
MPALLRVLAERPTASARLGKTRLIARKIAHAATAFAAEAKRLNRATLIASSRAI